MAPGVPRSAARLARAGFRLRQSSRRSSKIGASTCSASWRPLSPRAAWYLSTVAYQGARGMDPAELIRLNAFAPAPDVCFVFDVDPELGRSRICKRGAGVDLFEQEQTLAAARRIFTDSRLFRATIPNLYVLDAMADAAALEARIAELVFASLGRTIPR
jgi:hypothetical protein